MTYFRFTCQNTQTPATGHHTMTYVCDIDQVVDDKKVWKMCTIINKCYFINPLLRGVLD